MEGLEEKHRAINPYNKFRRFWEYVMFFFSVIVLFELPFEWIYEIPLTYKWIIPSLVMDVFFAIDVYISQNTGILEFGVVTLNKKYIRSKLTVLRKIVYWITPIPFYLIGYFVKSEKVYRILITFKVLRIVRLGEAIHTFQTSLIYVGPYNKMLVLLAFLLFIDHIFACIFWLVGNKELPGPSWLHEVAFIDNEPQLVQYIHTLYYITTTMLTIGYGDLHPYTFNEIIVIIVVECIGVFFYNFFLSNMVSIVADPSRTSFLEKYQKIYIAFKWRGVSNDSILELLRYFEYVWERNHDESDFYENAQRMPDSLKKKVALALHAQLFEKIDSIKDLSLESRAQIAIRLRPRIFTPGDYLIKAGSLSKKIFFLSSGKVQVLSSCGSLINSHEGPAGIIFGIGSFLNGSEEVTCVIAQTYVETYELTKGDFDDLKDNNEDFRTSMRTRKGPVAPGKHNFNFLNQNLIASPRFGHNQNLSGVSNIPPLGELPLLHSNATTINHNNQKQRRATTTLATNTMPSPRSNPSRDTSNNDNDNNNNNDNDNDNDSPNILEDLENREEQPKITQSLSISKLPVNASSLATMTTLNNRNSVVKNNPQLSLNQANDDAPTIQALSNSTIKFQNRKSIRISDVFEPEKKKSSLNLEPLAKANSLNLNQLQRSGSKASYFEAPTPKLQSGFPVPKPRSKEMPIRRIPPHSPHARQSIDMEIQQHKQIPSLPPLPSSAKEATTHQPENQSPILPEKNDSVAPLSPPKTRTAALFGPGHVSTNLSRADIPATHVPQLQPELPPLIPGDDLEPPKTSENEKDTRPPSPPPQPSFSPSQFHLPQHEQPQIPSQYQSFAFSGNAIVPKQKRIMISDLLKPHGQQNTEHPTQTKDDNKKIQKKNKNKHSHDDDDDDDEESSLESDVDYTESHPPV